jgi:hypothetical protein
MIFYAIAAGDNASSSYYVTAAGDADGADANALFCVGKVGMQTKPSALCFEWRPDVASDLEDAPAPRAGPHPEAKQLRRRASPSASALRPATTTLPRIQQRESTNPGSALLALKVKIRPTIAATFACSSFALTPGVLFRTA